MLSLVQKNTAGISLGWIVSDHTPPLTYNPLQQVDLRQGITPLTRILFLNLHILSQFN